MQLIELAVVISNQFAQFGLDNSSENSRQNRQKSRH